jgi:hypothetical protein
MMFIGDAIFPGGGNDYPAKQTGVTPIAVRESARNQTRHRSHTQDETGWIDAGLMRLPALTFARDVWAIPLAGEQAFFLLNPSSRTKVQTARRSVLIPRSASSAARPRVVNRPE